MPRQRLGQAFAAFHARANVADGVAHDLVGRLVGQRLERLDHGDARVNHRRQLPGEHHHVAQRDLAALGLAAFGQLFLDLDDQQVAVEQRGDGRLFRGGLDGVADFAAGGRFPGGVGE
jgi:hypothetical protein